MSSENHERQIALIVGARPNFVKIACLIPALAEVGIHTRLIHTGQHYDEKMSQSFFDELQIQSPDVNLGVGSGSHIWQITEVMRCLEGQFTKFRTQAVLVVGDVNSTLAATVAACKLGIRVGHVEAGLRSGDRGMPEEINRILTDSVSDWLFTSELSANDNLKREGISPQRIHFVGNVMIDTLVANLDRARQIKPHEALGITPRQFVLLTLHRPSNVDDPERLGAILAAVIEIAKNYPIVMPVHPRTRKRLEDFGEQLNLDYSTIRVVDPVSYLSMLGLMDACRFVMTDSGGIQEETTALGVPCLTIRENTERPITCERGTNRLVGWRTADILQGANEAAAKGRVHGSAPEGWDGKASQRIARILSDVLE